MEYTKRQLVPARRLWEDEAEFNAWLAGDEDHLEMLGASLRLDLELIAREMRTGGYADIVCCDRTSDAPVVIESQFGVADGDHLGRLLAYGQELGATTVALIAERFPPAMLPLVEGLNAALRVDIFLLRLAPEDEEYPRVHIEDMLRDTRLAPRGAAPGLPELAPASRPRRASSTPLVLDYPAHPDGPALLRLLWTAVASGKKNIVSRLAKEPEQGSLMLYRQLKGLLPSACKHQLLVKRKGRWLQLPAAELEDRQARREAFWQEAIAGIHAGTATAMRRYRSVMRGSHGLIYKLVWNGVRIAALHLVRERVLAVDLRLLELSDTDARYRYGQLHEQRSTIEAELQDEFEVAWLGGRPLRDNYIMRLKWRRKLSGRDPFAEPGLARELAAAVLRVEDVMRPFVENLRERPYHMRGARA